MEEISIEYSKKLYAVAFESHDEYKAVMAEYSEKIKKYKKNTKDI
jgi:hypothetical protein